MFTLSVIGLINGLFFWPILLIFHYSNFETLNEIPSKAWLMIVIRGVSALVMNFLINFGIAYSNSLIVSIGAFLSLPMNAFFDIFVWNEPVSIYKGIGTVIVSISFFMLLIPDEKLDLFENWRSRQQNCQDINI